MNSYYDRQPIIDKMMSLMVPLLAAYGYLNINKEMIQNLIQNQIVIFSFFHNLGLQLFSFYTFSYLSYVLYVHGVHANPGYYFSIPGVQQVLLWFYLSKYYEYIDTFILYAKGKEPIFLQKFHHAGASIVWHVTYMHRLDGLFFISYVNSGVHSIMYFYYLLSLFPNLRKKIAVYKIFVTCIQITQLFFGGIAVHYYYYTIESPTNRNLIIMFNTYNALLLGLFVDFMLKKYANIKR